MAMIVRDLTDDPDVRLLAHHKGGVDTAEAIVERRRNRAVVNLAGSIIKSQSSEMPLMPGALAARS